MALLERKGTPSRRASWPVACAACVYSGVPKAGAPERMSTLEVKPPYITGTPGRTIWARTIPAIASACCWASAPASVTGDMAPARVKGVMTLTWPCSASVISPSAIGTSSCSGELVLMMPVNTGRSTSDSRERPSEIATIAKASLVRARPKVWGCQFLSMRVISA